MPRSVWQEQADLLAAAVGRGEISDEQWFDGMAAIFDTAYVEGENRRAQSGFGGDDDRWEVARRPIATAIDAPGSFLDVGCANGYLLECLVGWADFEIEPYGIDIAPAVVSLARHRLPHWNNRFFVGNALYWNPPRRFDFVRTELLYVPDHLHRQLVDRLLTDVVEVGGRLIICGYGSPRSSVQAHPVRQLVRRFGLEPEYEITVEAPEGGGAIVEIAAIRQG